MPILRSDEWPEVGELVIATIDEITEYGAYVTLDEYGKEGFLHISEVSSGWIRNIRNYIHEGEKVVLKVLRVNPERNQIDLSLRRVTQREKREKIFLWKRSKKAESLLRSASQKIGISEEKLYDIISEPFEKAFNGIYEGLEAAAREGVNVLLKIGIPKQVAEVLAEIAKERIKLPVVKVKGTLNLTCTKPDGVLRIKKALLKAKESCTMQGAKVEIYVVAPPKYQIEVVAKDYKEANAILSKAAESAVETIVKLGGEGSFKSESGK
ncbi:translation initiation factor IF-2 subunit alpha [Candidatus Bathyarchaeota archaeon]|nr:translation initiation factor IF-2 subunit alpha [Candidatus Bathyarchaeota archaeon]